MYGVHRTMGDWHLMGHVNAFAQYLNEASDRAGDQFGSINWMMGMARRAVGSARVGVRAMFSLEPWTIPGCGYPDLLATGEVCEGEHIHDRQHPHDLFMELAADYDRPLSRTMRWQVYAGLAGEPALGPTAYPHRVSALPNPLAPITHHWLDATHITFGVLTAGVYGARWKAEGSVFNGREPDEERTGVDLDALDSFSGRLWWLPVPALAFQVSAGQLTESEVAEDGDSRADVDRITASASYHRALSNGIWASTLAWGRNHEDHGSTQALLMETSVNIQERDVWFGRFETGRKSAEDLDIEADGDFFVVSKLQAGYTRYLKPWHGLSAGVGVGMSAGFVPSELVPAYGDRVNLGFSVFVNVRTARAH
jgi:hypothetical protein